MGVSLIFKQSFFQSYQFFVASSVFSSSLLNFCGFSSAFFNEMALREREWEQKGR